LPEWDENGSRVAVVTEFSEDNNARIVKVRFEVYTYVEEEGGSSMQLSGYGTATMRMLESSHLGLQLIKLETIAIQMEEEPVAE